MKCPFCGYEDTRVVDSRPSDDGTMIRRRRVCEHCHRRFTTREAVETKPIMVIKKDGSRQEFDRAKLIERILRACQKREVSRTTIEQLADEIENLAVTNYNREIPTSVIGDQVLLRLWEIDQVAYVRFASVYRDFDSLDTFMKALRELSARREKENKAKENGTYVSPAEEPHPAP